MAACHRSVCGALADEAELVVVGFFPMLHCIQETLSRDLLARHPSLDALVHSGGFLQLVEERFAIDASCIHIDVHVLEAFGNPVPCVGLEAEGVPLNPRPILYESLLEVRPCALHSVVQSQSALFCQLADVGQDVFIIRASPDRTDPAARRCCLSAAPLDHLLFVVVGDRVHRAALLPRVRLVHKTQACPQGTSVQASALFCVRAHRKSMQRTLEA